MNWVWFHRFGSPPYFYRFAGRWAPWFLGISLLLLAVGLYGGLVVAPPDYYQSEWDPLESTCRHASLSIL